MNYSLIAICPDEVKPTVVAELQELGATHITPGFKAVMFEVTEEQYYMAHLRLATVSQLLRIIKNIPAQSEKILESQAQRIDWPSIFSAKETYKIDGIVGGEGTMSANLISKQVRLAIEEVFAFKNAGTPQVNLEEPDVLFKVLVRHGKASISVNTSGKPLHKRGYRMPGHPAPLKETLAAALLKFAEYDGSQTFLDPMCGSGTIAIEAAFIALKKACNIHRKKGQFGFEHLQDFNKDLWRKVQDDERQKRRPEPAAPLYASDISDAYVTQARENALRARVEKDIVFATQDFFQMTAPQPTGILVTNLPYGERIDSSADMVAYYKRFGDHLKKNFTGWKACLLVAEDSPWKSIGLKPTRRIPILNGAIKAKFLIFELYAGTKRTTKE